MDATFFVSPRKRALGVRDIDQLPSEPVGESLRSDSPGALHALVQILSAGVRGAVQPLRDATCQSFPVWSFAPEFSAALMALDDDEIDGIAEQWLAHETAGELDADAYELSLLLGALREALSDRDGPDHELFVLLEERAL
jgi:hypothetical protein